MFIEFSLGGKLMTNSTCVKNKRRLSATDQAYLFCVNGGIVLYLGGGGKILASLQYVRDVRW